jgi:hypothetical protein
MIKSYRYTVEGSGSQGQTFTTDGIISCEFHDVLNTAMLDTFDKLTKGRAVFGKPGMGCAGPYDLHRFIVEQVKQ